jgi:hypothetical protein
MPRAIQCFEAQTYPRKRLLVLYDKADDVAHDLFHDSRIEVYLASRTKLTIGAKRNEASFLATGELIAVWDDDDVSSRTRLTDQVERLILSGKAVTGYHTLRFTNGVRWHEYCGADNYAPGTTLMYRRDWWEKHPFPDLQVGEDAAFVKAAAQEDQLITTNAGNHMYATVHPGNTAPKQFLNAHGAH